jgi:hypothetical protein
LDGAIQKKQKNCQYYETKKIEKNPFENDWKITQKPWNKIDT